MARHTPCCRCVSASHPVSQGLAGDDVLGVGGEVLREVGSEKTWFSGAHGDRTNERRHSVLWPVEGELLGGGVRSSLLEDKEEKESQIPESQHLGRLPRVRAAGLSHFHVGLGPHTPGGLGHDSTPSAWERAQLCPAWRQPPRFHSVYPAAARFYLLSSSGIEGPRHRKTKPPGLTQKSRVTTTQHDRHAGNVLRDTGITRFVPGGSHTHRQ